LYLALGLHKIEFLLAKSVHLHSYPPQRTLKQ